MTQWESSLSEEILCGKAADITAETGKRGEKQHEFHCFYQLGQSIDQKQRTP
jgi:hypothetical protein